MLTISIIAQKGGSGKTTVARCLAVSFELSGRSAAIIDLDPQASATLWGDRRGEDNPPEVISTALPLLDKTLAAAKASVDVVLIDTPPKSSEAALAAAKAADLVLIPCRPQIDDIETLPATRQLLELVGKGDRSFVVLNSVPSYRPRTEEAMESIKSHPKGSFDVCSVTFGQRAAFGDSSVVGRTPSEFDPDGKASEECEKLYKFVKKIVSM